MTTFIDTSAFYSVLDRDDRHHLQAHRRWKQLLENKTVLVTTNYVLVETIALLQNRIGMESVLVFQEDIVPLLQVEWVNEDMHQAGMMAMLTAARRNLSQVDCISFEVMRRLGLKRVFAFDRHFREQGFNT